MGTPKNTITVDYSKVELQERTNRFIAEGGPWKRYIQGLVNLEYIIKVNTHPPQNYQGLAEIPSTISRKRDGYDEIEQRPYNLNLKLYRPDYVPYSYDPMPPEQLESASGEILLEEIWDRLANGPLCNIQFDFEPVSLVLDEVSRQYEAQPKAIKYEEAASGLVKAFQKEYSDVETCAKVEEMIQNGEKVTALKAPFYRGITHRWEEFRENPQEIGRWLEANRSVIPESDRRLMEEQIKACSDAYTEVLDYVSYAQGYLMHHAGKDKRNEIIIGG
jgi:hypothetical protein